MTSAVTMSLAATVVLAATVAAASLHGTSPVVGCETEADCLLLGSCETNSSGTKYCKCRQGFTGPQCGQLDVGAVPNHLGYRNETASTWGGLPVYVNGEWHAYVSMMANSCPLGTFNNNSQIVHLVSKSNGQTDGGWAGPFDFVDAVVKPFAHNAAPRLLADGSVGVWFIGYNGTVEIEECPGGVAPPHDVWPDWSGKQIALARSPPNSPSGPWNVSWLFALPTLPDDWWHWDCSATNPSALVDADGSVRMMYRGTMCTHCAGCPTRPGNTSERLGIATARALSGPYARASSAIDLGNASIEDPFYWRGSNGSHHLIGHSGTVCKEWPGGGNWCGVIASSSDGLVWQLASAPAYGPNITLANGTVVQLFARQRPQLLFEYGSAAARATEPRRLGGDEGSTTTSAAPRLLAVVNGAELARGTTSLMQGASFTLIQPVQ